MRLSRKWYKMRFSRTDGSGALVGREGRSISDVVVVVFWAVAGIEKVLISGWMAFLSSMSVGLMSCALCKATRL